VAIFILWYHEVMKSPVTTKADMYKRLAAGEFGSTIPQYFSLADWLNSGQLWIEFWGVRTMTPGGPCRLNCPVIDVVATAREFEAAGHRVNISMMVDKVATVTAWLELWDSPTGFVVEGIEWPKTPEWTWRNSMPDPDKRKRWEGIAARMVLKRHLNANSLEDVWQLIEDYPDHVIEMSSLDRCIGTVPHRNHVCWEVRAGGVLNQGY
jgi:hypothetical protein